ncbi:MAG: Gfo/Idh/MocA family protein [Candidatus Dormibacteraceae bacterium]
MSTGLGTGEGAAEFRLEERPIATRRRTSPSLRLGVIGTGWIGATRAATAAANGSVAELHLAEVDPEARARVGKATGAGSARQDYRELLELDLVDAVIISTAPETTHHPIARDCLRAGKHVLLEKPMALTLPEADELLDLARAAGVRFTVGYTQRFVPKFAYVKERFTEGSLGRAVTIMISRHITRSLGAKISSRGELGPAQMEGTHDIDLALWWLEPARPVRVYAQSVAGIMKDAYGLPDCIWVVVTMEDGSVFTIGANWNLPLEAPGFSSVIAEVVGTNGALFVDESHRDLLLSTVEGGLTRPLSSMPGERVGHVYRGPMEAETNHFIDCASNDLAPVVTAGRARLAMEVALAAELSAEAAAPIELPLAGESPRSRRPASS